LLMTSQSNPAGDPLLSLPVEGFQSAAVTVSTGTPVADLPRLLADNRACNTIAVVDNAGVLTGIIPVHLIVEDLLFEVMPGELLGELLEPGRAADLARGVQARTAAELMQPSVSVLVTTPVREAIHRLHGAGLMGIPVTEADGHVTGYLDLLDVLLAWWRRQAGEASH
jgi:CBS-domain-containing membrane protein